MRVFTKSTIATMWGRGDMRFILEEESQAEIARLQAERDTAWNDAIDAAADHVEQRDGSIPYRQEIARDIRALRKEST